MQAEAEDYRQYTLDRSGGRPEARSILQEAGLDRQRWPRELKQREESKETHGIALPGPEREWSQSQEACGQSEQFEFLGGGSNWRILTMRVTDKVGHIA